jgi:uncharacterized protein (DUF58 family)
MGAMNIFRKQTETAVPPFGEAFLRRLERLSFRTVPTLRGGLAGERRSRNLRPALDFSDHRPYTHGDDLRHIDWNAYSRHEELFVKLGEASQSVNVHILLDCSRSMAWLPNQSANTVEKDSPLKSTKWLSALRLAGALGYLGLAGGERVKLTPFAGQMGEGFGPTRGKRRAVSLLEFIDSLTPTGPARRGAESGLVNSLAGYARRHSYGGLLVLISDLLDTATPIGSEGEWEELAEGLRFFPAPRWQVLVLHLLSEAELQPTLLGDFDLQDMETGESLPCHLDELTIAQYRLRVRRWCAEVQSACSRRAATYARVVAEWPFEKAVVPYLRQRGAIQ